MAVLITLYRSLPAATTEATLGGPPMKHPIISTSLGSELALGSTRLEHVFWSFLLRYSRFLLPEKPSPDEHVCPWAELLVCMIVVGGV